MKLNQHTIEQLAEHLENAELQAFEVMKITEAHPDMDWDDAYGRDNIPSPRDHRPRP